MWFNIVRSSTLFTFGYPNVMLSFLQYISSYFNINIATFVGFQIVVYAYVVLRTFTYTSPVLIKKHAEQNSRIGSVAKRHSSVIFRHVYKCKSVRGLVHSPELAQFYYDTKDKLRNFSKNSFAFSRDFRNCFAICDLRGVNSDLVL